MDADPLSFETKYFAKEKHDVNSDMYNGVYENVLRTKGSLDPTPLPDFILQFFSRAAR